MGGGSFRLFRVAGVDVHVHFGWFLVAIYWITSISAAYDQKVWALYEFLVLFGIVLLHEFGHAFGCRSTGGVANQIMLWPLGGAAFVQPPPRPGAVLWTTVAGPLVNVVLLPFFAVLAISSGPAGPVSDSQLFVGRIASINILLLGFNLLPIYPLDGGQILRALLWYPLGRIRSLQVASVLGLAGAVGLGVFAFFQGNWWLGLLALFVFSQALAGWQHARLLQREPELPREMPIESHGRR
jgi:Zn-dependent protease